MSGLRFAVVTLGSLGDLHPFLAVARALAERGHRVHLLSQAPHEAAVIAEGVGFRPVASAADHDRTLRHPLLWHPLHGFGVLWRHLAVPAIGPTLEVLDDLAGDAGGGPLVVFASPLAAGARLAADRWPNRIRLVSGYTAPMGLRSTEDPMFLGGWQVPTWLPRSARQALWTGLDRWKLEPMARPALTGWCQRLGLPEPRASTFGDALHAPAGGIALYPDWFAAVPPHWRSRRVHQVGFPIFEPTASDPVDDALVEFLADPLPYVVAYPGSADQRAQSFADRVIGAAQAMGRRTLVLSRFASPAGHRWGTMALQVDHAPLSVVLPKARAFVHHGGIGSVAQGLLAATPQLVLASSYDQFENGARLTTLGAGRWRREPSASMYGVQQSLRALDRVAASEEPILMESSKPGQPALSVWQAANLLEQMSDQLALPGLEVETARFPAEHVAAGGRILYSYALFFALLPSPKDGLDLAKRGRRYLTEDGVSGSMTEPERLHLTLLHIADFPPGPDVPRAKIDAAISAGNDISSSELALSFTTTGTVPGGNNAYVLECDEISKSKILGLRAQLRTALKRRSVRPAKNPSPAHLTLAYGSSPFVPKRGIETVTWHANRLVLILSYRGLTHHQHIREWELKQPASEH